MIELVGDSARGGEWAVVRLRVDGERHRRRRRARASSAARRADAARGGGGRRARRSPSTRSRTRSARSSAPRRAPSRVAVAMSGGVDSAVALLRAGPNAVGVTLRLWLDPDGPDAERACCSPSAVLAARETCHALGLPHVTLDLREEFRRAVVDAVRPRLRARRDAEPVHPLQRRLPLRRAARVRRAASAPRGSRPGTTRGSSSTAAGSCSPAPPTRRRTSRTCSRASIPRSSTRLCVPARGADEGRDARRGRGAPASPPPAARESQEACFLAGDDYRAFLERHGPRPRAGPDRRRGRPRARPPRRLLALHAGPAARARRLRDASRCTRSATDAATNTVVVGPRDVARPTTVAARGRLYVAVVARRGEAPLPLAGGRRDGRADRRRLPPRARRAGVRRRAPARRPCSTRATPSSAAGVIASADALRSRSYTCPRARFHLERPRRSRPRGLPARDRHLGLAYVFVRLGGTFERLSSFIKGTERRAPAGDQQRREEPWTESTLSSTRSIRLRTAPSTPHKASIQPFAP